VTVPTKRRRGILPFDSDHLTDPEKALQLEQEHNTCVDCDWLGQQRRNGTRGCEHADEHDPGPVLAGEVRCLDYMPRKER